MACARCDGDAGDTSEALFAGELGEDVVLLLLLAASHACTVGVPNSTFLSSCFCIACTQTDAAAAAAADADTTYKTIAHMFSGGHFTAPSDRNIHTVGVHWQTAVLEIQTFRLYTPVLVR
jgi:hypothetical protein